MRKGGRQRGRRPRVVARSRGGGGEGGRGRRARDGRLKGLGAGRRVSRPHRNTGLRLEPASRADTGHRVGALGAREASLVLIRAPTPASVSGPLYRPVTRKPIPSGSNQRRERRGVGVSSPVSSSFYGTYPTRNLTPCLTPTTGGRRTDQGRTKYPTRGTPGTRRERWGSRAVRVLIKKTTGTVEAEVHKPRPRTPTSRPEVSSLQVLRPPPPRHGTHVPYGPPNVHTDNLTTKGRAGSRQTNKGSVVRTWSTPTPSGEEGPGKRTKRGDGTWRESSVTEGMSSWTFDLPRPPRTP